MKSEIQIMRYNLVNPSDVENILKTMRQAKEKKGRDMMNTILRNLNYVFVVTVLCGLLFFIATQVNWASLTQGH